MTRYWKYFILGFVVGGPIVFGTIWLASAMCGVQ